MTITPSTNRTPGVKHFQVVGDSGASYVLTHVRRARMNRWTCSCLDFIYRRQHKGSHKFCKHLKALREFQNHKQVTA